MTKIIDWLNDLFFGGDDKLGKQVVAKVNEELKRLSRIEHAACHQYKIESEKRIEVMQETINVLHAQSHAMTQGNERYDREIKALENIAESIRGLK